MKKREKMHELSTKMQHIVGVGPITDQTIDFFHEETGNREEARKRSVQEFLSYRLDFTDEEMMDINIVDTKRGNKKEIIYFAVENKETIKEIHFRRAACGNDSIQVLDYIPPQYHTRYMAVGKRAADIRSKDKTIKTQIRWGEKDLEIYTKKKGGDNKEQFKRIELIEFMGGEELPEVDCSIKWRWSKERVQRREMHFNNEGLPSMRNNLIRQHSTNRSTEMYKKQKLNADSSEGSRSNTDTEMEEEDGHSQVAGC